MAAFYPGKIRRIKEREEQVYKFFTKPQKRGKFMEIQYSNGLRKRIVNGTIRYYRYRSDGTTIPVRNIYPDGSITNYEENQRDYISGNPFQDGSPVAYRESKSAFWTYV